MNTPGLQMDYRAELERLDKKFGRVHGLADCSVAYQKSVNTPELLEDRDFVLIGFVHGDKGVSEARMRQMKTAAALAEAQGQLTKVVPPASVMTKRVTPEPPKTLDEFLQRFGKKPVTWADLMKALDVTDAVLIKAIKALRVRADTLEQANEDLKNRLLELEAQNASERLVPHAER